MAVVDDIDVFLGTVRVSVLEEEQQPIAKVQLKLGGEFTELQVEAIINPELDIELIVNGMIRDLAEKLNKVYIKQGHYTVDVFRQLGLPEVGTLINQSVAVMHPKKIPKDKIKQNTAVLVDTNQGLTRVLPKDFIKYLEDCLYHKMLNHPEFTKGINSIPRVVRAAASPTDISQVLKQVQDGIVWERYERFDPNMEVQIAAGNAFHDIITRSIGVAHVLNTKLLESTTYSQRSQNFIERLANKLGLNANSIIGLANDVKDPINRIDRNPDQIASNPPVLPKRLVKQRTTEGEMAWTQVWELCTYAVYDFVNLDLLNIHLGFQDKYNNPEVPLYDADKFFQDKEYQFRKVLFEEFRVSLIKNLAERLYPHISERGTHIMNNICDYLTWSLSQEGGYRMQMMIDFAAYVGEKMAKDKVLPGSRTSNTGDIRIAYDEDGLPIMLAEPPSIADFWLPTESLEHDNFRNFMEDYGLSPAIWSWVQYDLMFKGYDPETGEVKNFIVDWKSSLYARGADKLQALMYILMGNTHATNNVPYYVSRAVNDKGNIEPDLPSKPFKLPLRADDGIKKILKENVFLYGSATGNVRKSKDSFTDSSYVRVRLKASDYDESIPNLGKYYLVKKVYSKQYAQQQKEAKKEGIRRSSKG